jgi:quinohemoprotein ethanol dehydrogenase
VAGPGRTYDEQRFSPLDQINVAPSARLGLAWFADINTERGMEASPLVIDGVLYNVQPWNIVTAYDARTGACCGASTRRSRRASAASLAATSSRAGSRRGRQDLRRHARRPADRARCQDGAAGVVGAHGRQLEGATRSPAPAGVRRQGAVGNGGAEIGVRGYVSAYDAASGAQLWRLHTVPGNPADGFENTAMERAAATWNGEWWKSGGGGTVWDSVAYDPRLHLVYIGTGNGSPWSQRWRSPGGGDNLFLASIVALRADTGEYVWHYQTVPGEEWDYTATQQMILADVRIGGRTRQVLMQAPKNGFFYVLDRRTGELLSADMIVPVNWATGIDPASGRPIENPAVRYGTTPVMVSPGAGGAHNWNPMAYSPRTGLVYVPVTETYMAYGQAETFDPARGGLGTSFTGFDAERKAIAEYADAHSRGWLSAWNPATRREVWRGPIEQKGSGGVLVTAGNLVFQGTIGTTFAAYRADTWRQGVGDAGAAGADLGADRLRSRRRAVHRGQRRLGRRPRACRALAVHPAAPVEAAAAGVQARRPGDAAAAPRGLDAGARAEPAAGADRDARAGRARRAALRPELRAVPRGRGARRGQGLAPHVAANSRRVPRRGARRPARGERHGQLRRRAHEGAGRGDPPLPDCASQRRLGQPVAVRG